MLTRVNVLITVWARYCSTKSWWRERHLLLMLPLAILLLLVLDSCGRHSATPFVWDLPAGFPEPLVPQTNPMTQEKVALGRYLFYDVRLSANQTQACSSCHQQQHAFAGNTLTATGSTGDQHRRNTLSLTNVAYNKTFTWAHNGLTSLERQILIPMFGKNPVEMGLTGQELLVLQRLQSDSRYPALFAKAFTGHDPISLRNIVDALACFVRSLVSFNTPFDRYAYYLNDQALSESALRGLDLFMSERLECRHCHSGFNFTQANSHSPTASVSRAFHNIGLYNPPQPLQGVFDQGLFELTGREEDKGLFRAPTLRNIEYTAPYMHDGSIASLEEVIQFYSDGGRNIPTGRLQGDGRKHPNKDVFIKGFTLTEGEKLDLLNFLKSLSDESFITNKDLADPFAPQIQLSDLHRDDSMESVDQ